MLIIIWKVTEVLNQYCLPIKIMKDSTSLASLASLKEKQSIVFLINRISHSSAMHLNHSLKKDSHYLTNGSLCQVLLKASIHLYMKQRRIFQHNILNLEKKMW
jgi:hypothetical protein